MVSDTKVNMADMFDYEFPTSSPPWSISNGMTSCMRSVVWRPSLFRSTTVLTWTSSPFRNSSMRVWVESPIELGRRLRGGVGWPSLLDVGIRENFSGLTSSLLSNVSRSRQTVFVLVETPWPGPTSLWALVLWVLW